jgi:hypothetical protein
MKRFWKQLPRLKERGLLSTFLLLVGLATPPAQGQNFWQTTAPAPFGPKSGLLAIGDSTLLTAVPAGLLRSINQGRTWALARRTRPVHTLHATRQGLLLAGGTGMVYRSRDAGATWDSVAVAATYPVTAFADTPQGDLLLGTGGEDPQHRDAGDGIFFSADGGRTWTPRNTGLGAARRVTHLLDDAQGRLFAATTDYDDPTRQPGLYRSTAQSQLWQYLPVRLNGAQWTIPITVYEVTNLAIRPGDSLLCSFMGVAQSVGIQGNYIKSLAEATTPSIDWQPLVGRTAPRWWDRAPMLPLHLARDGSWYSSRLGLSSGGTLRSVNRGRNWSLLNSGLGWSSSGLREQQFFAEFPSGKLFMVQLGDAQVYYHQATALAGKTPRAAPAVQLFPNPTTGLVHVASVAGQRIVSLTLYDLQGRLLRTVRPTATPATIDLTAETPGMYQVVAELADGRQVRQKVLRQ